jgi:Flp pilus assembly protein TadD
VTAEHDVAKARAEAALELRRPAEARVILEQVLARSPEDAEALVLLARACADEKDFPRSYQLTRSASAAAPDDVVILVACADIARESGDLEAAHFWAARALELAPDSVAALNVMSLVEAQRGNGAEALVYAQEALRYGPQDPDLLVAQGMAFDTADALGDAAAHYAMALEIDPQHVYALNNLAVVQLQCGDLKRASGLLGRAIALDPRLEILRGNLDIAGKLARMVLLSRLGLGTVLAATMAFAGLQYAWVLIIPALLWTAAGIVRLPAPARRRLGHGLGWQDLVISGLIVLAIPIASRPRNTGPRPSTFLAWIVIFAVTVMGRLYWNRFKASRRLRELGVRLPEG